MGILSIDFGGTRTRAAFYSDDLQQIKRDETRSLVDQPAQAVIERILQTARNVVPTNETIHAIGISAPGPLDARAGIIHSALTLPGWRDTPLAHIVSTAFNSVPTYIENDANLAALAEYEQGAAQGCDPAIYLTLSTGIGGGAIMNGQLFTGWSGLAIEPGHMRFTLPSGEIKRLEDLASGTAIARTAQVRLKETTQASSLRNAFVVDGQAVGEAAEAGDALARQIVQEAGTWLGLGFVNLLHLYSPQVIVLGGSVSKLGDLILQPAWEVIHAHILEEGFIPPNLIRLAQLGDDVCLVGAALYASRQIKKV